MDAAQICSIEPGERGRLDLVLWTLNGDRYVLGSFDPEGRDEAEAITANIGTIVLEWWGYGLDSGIIISPVGKWRNAEVTD